MIREVSNVRSEGPQLTGTPGERGGPALPAQAAVSETSAEKTRNFKSF